MKKNMTRIGAYTGTAAGLMLYAVFGLLPGLFLGGVMGMNLATALLGTPVFTSYLARLIVGGSMVAGIMITCVIYVVGMTSLGWLIGRSADALAERGKRRELAASKA